jgi:hypothetical protein
MNEESRPYFPPPATDVSYAGRRRESLGVADRVQATRKRQHDQVATALADSQQKITKLEEELLQPGLSPVRRQDLNYRLLRQRAISASLERSRRQMIDEDERERKQLRESNAPEWVTHRL